MIDQLLKTLGLSPDLPTDELLERLEEKSLEYRERIDACADETRRAQLKETQLQIESALLGLRSGIALRKSAPPAATPSPQKTAAPTGKDAPKPDTPKTVTDVAAAPAANPSVPPQPKADPQQRKRELFEKAQSGDGPAALALAEEYRKEGNRESAKKWLMIAHERKTPGAGSALLALCEKKPDYQEALLTCAEELAWLAGYDRYAMCDAIYAAITENQISDDTTITVLAPALAALPKDEPGRVMLEQLYSAAEARQKKAQEKASREKAMQQAEQQKLEAALAEAERQQQEAEKAKAKQAAKEKWEKRSRILLPILSCLLLPLLLSFGYNRLFLLIWKEEASNSSALLAVIFLAPILFGTITCLVSFIARRREYAIYHLGNAIKRALLISTAVAVGFLCILILVGRIFPATLEVKLPYLVQGFSLGPVRIPPFTLTIRNVMFLFILPINYLSGLIGGIFDIVQ